MHAQEKERKKERKKEAQCALAVLLLEQSDCVY